MAINLKIEDGDGSGIKAKVNEGGYLFVQDSNLPPIDNRDLQLIYRKNLTLNDDGATTEMTVDGSTSSQLFYIQSVPEKDIFITSLSIYIQATGIALGQDFAGSGVDLTNGCRLYYEDENGEINIGTDLINNFSFVRLCQGNVPFGDNSTAFIKTDGVDAVFPTLNFKKVFGFQNGIKLLRGTTNKLVLEVNDDLVAGSIVAANAGFNIIANGFELK